LIYDSALTSRAKKTRKQNFDQVEQINTKFSTNLIYFSQKIRKHIEHFLHIGVIIRQNIIHGHLAKESGTKAPSPYP
jgi:hypothetical protein